MEKYDVFVSYRRDGGEGVAGRICDKLSLKGYKVFYDVESMRSGAFNEQIYDAIDICSDVLVVLPIGGLDRCISEDDWVRLEIAYALKKNKNIIPVMLRNFEFPEVLTDDIKKIKMLEGVTASMEYFDATMARIESLLLCKKGAEAAPLTEIPESKIKIPLFLKTPVVNTKNGIFCEINGGIANRYWWHRLTSGDMPSIDENINTYILNEIESGRKTYAPIPYFIHKITDRNTGVISIDIELFKRWKNSFDNIENIQYIPKRYKDDSVNAWELVRDIQDLAQSCLYNESDRCLEAFMAELVMFGKQLTKHYNRKEDFDMGIVIDYCLKCFVCDIPQHVFDIPYMCHYAYKPFKQVPVIIYESAKLYGVYEDSHYIVNKRLKLFLKYFQLISLFLNPEADGKSIKKYLLINYKYLKKQGVILTKENEDLFEKLINVFSVIKKLK